MENKQFKGYKSDDGSGELNMENKCNCEEISCKEGCVNAHTHKTFWCEKCHPERYENKQSWEIDFYDFWYETGKYKGRPLGYKQYIAFIKEVAQEEYTRGRKEGLEIALGCVPEETLEKRLDGTFDQYGIGLNNCRTQTINKIREKI